MKQVKAILCADLHLAPRIYAHRPIEGDSYYSLSQIADLAIKHDVRVIGAGDLIDRQINRSESIVQFMRQLDRLQKANLEFFYIQGQHELSQPPWLSAHSCAYHLHGRRCSSGSLVMYGIDYQPLGQLQRELERVPADVQLLVTHQVWSNLMGDICAPQGSWEQVSHAPLMLTGDYHVSYVDEEVTCGDGHRLRVINPGSTCMQAINEPADKYVALLYDDLSIEKVKLRTRRFHDFGMLHNSSAVDQFVTTVPDVLLQLREQAERDKLPPELLLPLLRVRYPHELAGAKQRIEKAVGAGAHLFLKQDPPPRPESDRRRELRRKSGLKHATTLESKLEEYLETQDKSYLLSDCQRLLQPAQDPAEELLRMQQDYV